MTIITPQTFIVLTATVDPRGAMSTARSAPLDREADYVNALRRWCDVSELPVIFCENSGWDLQRIEAQVGRPGRIRFLSFVAPEFPKARGKSYGELLIMAHILKELREASDDTRLIKITGRLTVLNAKSVLQGIQRSGADVVAALSSRHLDYSESRLFAASVRFIRDYLLPGAEMMDETAVPIMNFERALGRAILRAVCDGCRWEPFVRTPIFVGRAGTTNARYLNLRFPAKEAFRLIRGVAARYDL